MKKWYVVPQIGKKFSLDCEFSSQIIAKNAISGCPSPWVNVPGSGSEKALAPVSEGRSADFSVPFGAGISGAGASLSVPLKTVASFKTAFSTKTPIRKTRFWLRQSGELLRAAGVRDGDLVCVDFSKMPRLPAKDATGKRIYDLVLCRAVYPLPPFRPTVMLAEYVGVFGGRQTVCTRPLSKNGGSLGCAFEAETILATVTAVCCSDRRLKRLWNLRDNPSDLLKTDTVRLSD